MIATRGDFSSTNNRCYFKTIAVNG
jgi:hypothetical protein